MSCLKFVYFEDRITDNVCMESRVQANRRMAVADIDRRGHVSRSTRGPHLKPFYPARPGGELGGERINQATARTPILKVQCQACDWIREKV